MSYSEREMVDIEVAPSCNFNCPECLVFSRLRNPSGQYNSNLPELLVRHLPEGAQANFIGLGEPTLPKYQRDIAYVLESRPDLKGFIQSNGSQRLNGKLSELVDSGRLDVGVSYDVHHAEGSLSVLNPNGLQGSHVAGVSIAVGRDSYVNSLVAANILSRFPNIRKVLVEPLHTLETNEPTVGWEDVMNFTYDLREKLGRKSDGIPVFNVFYPHLSFGSNREYREKALTNLESVKGDWHVDSITKTPVLVKDIRNIESRMPRVLTNGLVLDETTSAWLGWDFLGKEGTVSVDFQNNRHYLGEKEKESDLEFKVERIESAF